MSSRFQRLELDESSRELAPARTPHAPGLAPLLDGAHWMRQAEQSRRKGLFEQALREYSRAVELDRSVVTGWVGQVRMLILLAEFPEAELWARKALDLFRNHPDLNAGRGQALCRMGDLKQAQAAADAAINQPGSSVYPWLARGDLMLAKKEAVEEHCFHKATELSTDWLTLIEVAEIYRYYHRHAKALARCQQAIAKASDQPYAWLLQGKCEAAMGMDDAARRSLSHCLELDPTQRQAKAAMESSRSGGGWLRRLLGHRS